uniref:Uncharacterized protein n=1 Tax=Arundo donax TaxID=35708 RepID=A0A0A9AHL7_ARUDO
MQNAFTPCLNHIKAYTLHSQVMRQQDCRKKGWSPSVLPSKV